MNTSAEKQGEEFQKDLPGLIVSRMQKHAWMSSESLARDIGRIVGANTVSYKFHGNFFEQVLPERIGPHVSIRQIGTNRGDGGL